MNDIYWLVQLPGIKTLIVKATDRTEAWEEFRRQSGVISTPETPCISPSDSFAFAEQERLRKPAHAP